MQDNKVGQQKSYKQFGHFRFIVFVFLFSMLLNASSFSEFKSVQMEKFHEYKDNNDKLFNNYLQSKWEEYEAKKPTPLYTLIKPSEIIPAKKKESKKLGPKVNIDIQGKEKTPLSINIIKNIIKDIHFDFFGTQLSLDTPFGLKKAKFYPQNQKGISIFFNLLVRLEYKKFISDIKNITQDLALNDWGKYLLIKKISENIFESRNDSRLLSWFIFNKLGYSLRVGLANKQVIVMYNSEKVIYDTPSYRINNKKFYVLSNYAKGRIGRLYTYEHDYPKSNKSLDLSLGTLPKLGQDLKMKHLVFKLDSIKYTIAYRYNQNIINFMATYPQADYETYFNGAMDTQSYNDIANGLRKYINNKTSSEAINFVLHFVQLAFKYEVDRKQFGREKVMFAQETLYYENSDCEDRAILFAYLVKKLFKIGIVGVKYKDHMATALSIPMKGDSVRANSRKYIIADPTYINSIVGQSMKKYKSKKPEGFVYLKKEKG